MTATLEIVEQRSDERRVTVLHGETSQAARAEMKQQVLQGLGEQQKWLPSIYFYDDVGSLIFQKITELKEYYVTRCEQSILQRDASKMVRDHMKGRGEINLVELGAGDSRKTNILLRQMAQQGLDFTYYPVDISAKAIDLGLSTVSDFAKANRFSVSAHGLVADNISALEWIRDNRAGNHTVVLFLGSSLGNYATAESLRLLHEIRHRMGLHDTMLLGFDLKKDSEVLQAAYSDSAGVTRDFNLNLLRRINSTLDADFDLDEYEHVATYNATLGAMESWLVAKSEQTVTISDRSFSLRTGESIHTEISAKYSVPDLYTMAESTGFSCRAVHLDEKKYFANVVWEAVQPGPNGCKEPAF